MDVTTIKNAKKSNVVVKRDNIRLRTIFTIASLLLSTLHLIVLIWSFFYIKYADEAKIVSIVAFVNFLVMSYDSITSRNVEIAKRILPVIGIPLNELNRIKEAIHQGIYFLTDMFWWKAEDKAAFEATYNIIHSDAYTVYGCKRTGCAGCPFAGHFEDELTMLRQHEPKLANAVEHIFAPSYEYIRAYRIFKERNCHNL